MARITLTPAQMRTLNREVYPGDHAASCTLVDAEAIEGAGLDLPAGTVELRQGDSFTAVTPDGVIVEGSGHTPGQHEASKQLDETCIAAAGDVVIRDHGGVLLMTDEDGNWTDLERARIVRLTAEQHTELESGSEIHQVGDVEEVAAFRIAS